jgi:hypothetical protein
MFRPVSSVRDGTNTAKLPGYFAKVPQLTSMARRSGASAWPAMRAVRVDVMQALRAD